MLPPPAPPPPPPPPPPLKTTPPQAVAVIVANLVLAGFYVSVMTVLMLSAEGAMGEVQKGVLV